MGGRERGICLSVPSWPLRSAECRSPPQRPSVRALSVFVMWLSACGVQTRAWLGAVHEIESYAMLYLKTSDASIKLGFWPQRRRLQGSGLCFLFADPFANLTLAQCRIRFACVSCPRLRFVVFSCAHHYYCTG